MSFPLHRVPARISILAKKADLIMQTRTNETVEERLVSLDVLRGIAVLGILVLNIFVFGYGFSFSGVKEIGYMVKQSNLDILIYRIAQVLVSGKMRGIFSVLFGASALMILSKEKNTGLQTVDLYYRRLVWLLIFGLFNGFVLLWMGDVLYCYAICGLFLFPLRNSSIKLLIGLIILFNLAITARVYIRHYETVREYQEYQSALVKQNKGDSLSTHEKSAMSSWKKKTTPPTSEEIKAAKEERSGGYFNVLVTNLRDTQLLESVLFYRYFFFDMMIMMLLGMLLYKAGYFSNSFPTRKLWATGIVGYVIGLPLAWWSEHNMHASGYHPIDQGIYRLIYPYERFLITLGHICLILLAVRLKSLKWIAMLLEKTGKMAFTNYLLQSVICLFIFSGFALDLYAKLRVSELMIVVICIWIFEIIFSVVWSRYFSVGPFEWVWRSLVHWTPVPIRKMYIPSGRR